MGRGSSKAGNGGWGKVTKKASADIQKKVYGSFVTPFDSKKNSHSETWMSALKDKIVREAMDRGLEITIKQMDEIADKIVESLPTEEEVFERFRPRR